MNPDPESARVHRFAELAEGRSEQRDYPVTAAVYEHFLAAFDDRSPIHVDEPYAQSRGLPGRVMHGAILNGFLSHFVGMHFPGKHSLLLAVDLRYSQPFLLGDSLRLEARVAQRVEAQRVVVLHVTFTNLTRGGITARGKTQVQLAEAA